MMGAATASGMSVMSVSLARALHRARVVDQKLRYRSEIALLRGIDRGVHFLHRSTERRSINHAYRYLYSGIIPDFPFYHFRWLSPRSRRFPAPFPASHCNEHLLCLCVCTTSVGVI